MTIPIFGDKNPGSPRDEIRTHLMGREWVIRNVTYPTLTPVLPPAGTANGTAVIVAPGGGFSMLAMQNEGWRIANALAARGVTAFVLKYRLTETPKDDKAFLDGMMKAYAAAGKPAAATGKEAGAPAKPAPAADDSDMSRAAFKLRGADKDALAALRLIRARAGEWKVNPARVGIIGFSAGALTALSTVLTASTPAERPDFFGYIYGPMNKVDVPAGAPPMFAALAVDDALFGKGEFGIVSAWVAAGRPVELHAYEAGNHGFGLGKAGTTTTGLMPQFLAWLDARGLLKPQ